MSEGALQSLESLTNQFDSLLGHMHSKMDPVDEVCHILDFAGVNTGGRYSGPEYSGIFRNKNFRNIPEYPEYPEYFAAVAEEVPKITWYFYAETCMFLKVNGENRRIFQ